MTRPTPQQRTTNYVCAEHHSPTDWRGRGCPDCTYQHSLNRRQRRNLRRYPDNNR